MTSFDAARGELAQAQVAADSARAAVRAALNAGGRDPQLSEQFARASAALATAVAGFGAVNDPREVVGRLDDDAPFVLFPVRLETRFGSARSTDPAAAQQPQLWVRVYPDDCSIDTFEADLSATELANVKKYWLGIWRAAGDDGMQRAAWAALVAAHGSGRAGYVADTFRPTNLTARPTRAAATDEFLVIATDTALSPAEASAIEQYWTSVWTATTTAETDAARSALNAAVGVTRGGDLIAADAPYNLADTPTPPATKQSVAVATVFVIFPPDPPTKPSSWTDAPHVAAFPDRFVVLGYRGGVLVQQALGHPITLPLYVGPDPSADPNDAIHPDGADLSVPDELSWLADFDAAVAAGMGIAVDISADDARLGFDRLIVVGLSLAADATTAAATLAELLTHHSIGRAGLSLIPQGTPTHNVAGATSGYTRLDDADASYADRAAAPLFTVTADPTQAADGQWLASALGVDPAVLTGVHAAGGQDQARARAMQRALWPATLGYTLDKLLAPTFSDQAIDAVRSYFTEYVRGRGALPAVRIGGQAYGVLPTTAFSRIAWLDGSRRELAGTGFLAALLRLLRLIQADWAGLAGGVSHVGGDGDAHQILLDILGLHPDSAEYYWRYSQSMTELYNMINLSGFGPQFWASLVELDLQAAGVALLAHLGDPSPDPDLLQHAFFTESGLLQTIIDDRPPSDTDPVRSYTDDNRNYLTWLADAAAASLDTVVAETGFTGDASPHALLYLYLRHAILLGYYDTSYQLHRSAGFLTAPELAAMKPEAPFVHVDPAAPVSESRYAALYKVEPRITSNPTRLVSDYITDGLATLIESEELAAQVAALRQLAETPTAELERLFAEHIDACSYRLDAWLLGLPALQLDRMRTSTQQQQQDGEPGPPAGTGCYLGAYAWVENLVPSPAALQPVPLPDDVATDFAGTVAMKHDPGNGGYVHAPSLPHARSAAVLRSGYLANASSANPDTLAVNLSSDRVRLALQTLEGIRNGQSIGALLGYRFERGLHDSYGLAEVDKFIYPLRKAFPLVADALASTQTPPDVPIEAIEASNVLDGRKLIAGIASSGVSNYPFGVADLPAATPTEAAAIDAQVQAILDVNDAIGDVALAEGVHQAVQGNFDRVAATVDAYGVGSFPPDPEVVQTPAPGIGLTHRVAVHLKAGLTAPAGAGPRATAAPALEQWLGDTLPAPADVAATVTWTDPVDGTTARSAVVTLADLGLGALDTLELVRTDDVQAMTELDDRIIGHVQATAHPRADAVLTIQYRTAPAGRVPIFEASALLRPLRTLLTAARPLRATDLALANDARPDQNGSQSAARARIDAPHALLDTLITDLGSYLTPLLALLADPVAHRAALIGGVDPALDAAVALLQRAAGLGVAQSGWGFCLDWRGQTMRDLYAAVRAFGQRCDARLATFDAAIADYDALPTATPDPLRFRALQGAEAQVVAHLDALPATPAAMRAALPARRAALAAKRDQAAAVLTAAHPTFGAALAAANSILPVDDVDTETLDFTAFGDRAVTISSDLARALAAVAAIATTTAATLTAQLAAYAAATTAADQVSALTTAARALFGEAFLFLPDFTVPSAQASAWNAAVAAGTSGALTDYLTTTAGIADPVPEWATGLARVRPTMHAWESIGLLATAFGRAEPQLTPAQLPYTAGDPWLAMQLPPDVIITGDRLLYTAGHTVAFDATAPLCGLLIDEWTEVIPATTKDTGLAFQFDRPDNEAPQAILVVTPATGDGTWHWDDLVGAISETLDLAKIRTVEPADIDPTPYARLLPATTMAVTTHGISITTALAAANGVMLAREVLDNA